MRKLLLYGLLLAGVGLLAASPASAQLPLPIAVEGRVGAALPTGDFGRQASSGLGYGAAVTVQLIPNYGLYGGYSRTEFELEGEADGRAIDSGFAVGLTAAYPLFGTGIMPWLGTGLLFHELEVRGVSTSPGSSSPGWEVGGGLAIAVLPRIRLTPGIGYRTYTAPFLDQPEARISYVTAGVGLNVAF